MARTGSPSALSDVINEYYLAFRVESEGVISYGQDYSRAIDFKNNLFLPAQDMKSIITERRSRTI